MLGGFKEGEWVVSKINYDSAALNLKKGDVGTVSGPRSTAKGPVKYAR